MVNWHLIELIFFSEKCSGKKKKKVCHIVGEIFSNDISKKDLYSEKTTNLKNLTVIGKHSNKTLLAKDLNRYQRKDTDG